MKPLTVEFDVHFRRGRGRRRKVRVGPAPTSKSPGRVPRIARLMALAIRLDGLIRSRQVADYAELASLGHVTRARITQIMNLLQLAPDIQEKILFLTRVEHGRDPMHLRDLQRIAATLDSRKQRAMWRSIQASA